MLRSSSEFPAEIAGYPLDAGETGSPLLGEGGFGQVFRARHPQSGRLVALKLLLSPRADVQRFHHEAATLVRLNHPGIVGVQAFLNWKGRPVMVMDFVDGLTLDEWLVAAPEPSLLDQIRILTETARALAFAHEKGIQHRDIKLTNIMVDRNGHAQVLDFGLARRLELAGNSRSDTGFATPHYMSPELVQTGRTSMASDVFSFGVLAYRVLSGKLPFRGETEFIVQSAIVNVDPLPLRNIVRNLPLSCDQLVSTCLEKKPSDRFQTMGPVADRFTTIYDELRQLAARALLDQALEILKSGREVDAFALARQADQLWAELQGLVLLEQLIERQAQLLPPDYSEATYNRTRDLLDHGDPTSLATAKDLLEANRSDLPLNSAQTKLDGQLSHSIPPLNKLRGLFQRPSIHIEFAVVAAILFGSLVYRNFSEISRPLQGESTLAVNGVKSDPSQAAHAKNSQVDVDDFLRKMQQTEPQPELLPKSVQRKLHPKDGQYYVWIPPGKYIMGCSDNDSECRMDEHRRQVVIHAGFWMGESEVTQQAYERVLGDNPSPVKGKSRPVHAILLREAKEYCGRLGDGWRLPSEEQWEFAARAGSRGARHGDLEAIAWHGENALGTMHDVKTKTPNQWGLYDMLGNVLEWTNSKYDEERNVLRGGSWESEPPNVRVSVRYVGNFDSRVTDGGLRCVGDSIEP